MAIFFEVGAVLVALFFLYLIWKFISNPLAIIGNSILGIVAFFLMNVGFNVGIPITWLSVGVVAIGGILGVVLVFLMHVTRLGF